MKKYLLCICIVIVGIISIFLVNKSNDKTIKTISYNDGNLRISIDGESANTLPTTGTYYLVDYDCNNPNTKLIWDNDTYSLNVSNDMKKGGVSCNLNFKSKPLLSEMPVGSYVKYSGNNGCDDTNSVNGYSSCMGKNSNYVSDTNMGYCYSSKFKFYVNGWRIGYVKNDVAHLISAGAPECICTNSDDTIDYDGCSVDFSETIRTTHLYNMDSVALKYCNSGLAKDGVCSTDTAWAMDEYDFKEIFNRTLSTCNAKNSDTLCGYNNDLIDNGSYYWYGSVSGTNNIYRWSPQNRYVYHWYTNILFGVRPVLAIDSSIVVTGGDGTYESPYIIDGSYFEINGGAKYINSYDDLSAVSLSINTIEDASSMCISVDTSECTNYIDFSDSYTLDWSSMANGEKVVYVYLKNTDGDIVATISRSVIIDTLAPSNNSVSIEDSNGLTRTLVLASTGADFMCISTTSSASGNCTNWIDYSTSTSVTFASGVGTKTVYAFFKDEAGNISSSVSDSITCTTSICNPDYSYEYWLDATSSSAIYLMRSDGATAGVSGGDSVISWHTENSQNMIACSVDSSTTDPYMWCIGEDGNAYYKTGVKSSWNSVSISSYMSAGFDYYIFADSSGSAYLVRGDGLTNIITSSGLASNDWSYGYYRRMVACSGTSSSVVACLGSDGYLYRRLSLSTTTDYINTKVIKLTSLTSANSWIDMYGTNFVNVIEYDEASSSIYNTRASFSTATNTSWFGGVTDAASKGVRTCTSTYAGTNNYNICLMGDNYIYYKLVTASEWTKTDLVLE